ncbi:MAG: PD40 domain-containing protein [Acidobacteria bacterium]|nr:PD40 domain-containing protein [Acidobacteriota bacterium]MBI3425179.1 PD40 domain-containing protein [Acidobacteriota bacterium]
MRRQFNHLYEFGAFRLEVAEQRLTHRGAVVPLSPKLFDALLLLVENHGRLLEKDELIRTLWPDSFVEEGNLTHYISQLRKALGADANGQSLIETVPKRGYRFVAPVREVRAEWPIPQTAGTGIFVEETDTESRTEPPVLNSSNGAETDWLDWQDAEPTARVEPVAAPRETVVLAKQRPRSRALPLGLLALGLLSYAAYWWYTRPAPSARFAAAFQKMRPTKLTTNSSVTHLALSPDGKYLAYVQREGAQRGLWFKQTNAANSVQIQPAAEVTYRGVTFAPDGTQLYFVTFEKGSLIGKLYQIPTLGGTPRLLVEDIDSPVSFSPAGKQICFVRNDPARHTSALLLANSDGTQARPLMIFNAPEYLTIEGPAWSPDGEWIACVTAQRRVAGPNRKLLAVRVADGTTQLLAARPWPWIGQLAWLPGNSGVVANAWHEDSNAYSDEIWLFAWPPGAAHLLINDLNRYLGVSLSADARALATIQSTRISRLWVMPLGAPDEARALTKGLGDFYSEAFGLIWPPGDRIVYAANGGGNTDIWARRADGTPPQQLTRDSRVEILPTASAVGQTIVYVAYREGRPHLWRMEADGSRAQQITDGPGESDPALTPDGQWVVYTMEEGEQTVLWKVAIAGGTPERLFDDAATNPLFSPDGKWLACYLLDPQTKRQQVAVLPVDRLREGRAVAKFFPHMPAPLWKLLQWTPDSRALTYGVMNNGGGNLWLQPLDGSAPHALTDFKEDVIFRFAWSPDGKSLVYERGTTVNDVVLLSGDK